MVHRLRFLQIALVVFVASSSLLELPAVAQRRTGRVAEAVEAAGRWLREAKGRLGRAGRRAAGRLGHAGRHAAGRLHAARLERRLGRELGQKIELRFRPGQKEDVIVRQGRRGMQIGVGKPLEGRSRRSWYRHVASAALQEIGRTLEKQDVGQARELVRAAQHQLPKGRDNRQARERAARDARNLLRSGHATRRRFDQWAHEARVLGPGPGRARAALQAAVERFAPHLERAYGRARRVGARRRGARGLLSRLGAKLLEPLVAPRIAERVKESVAIERRVTDESGFAEHLRRDRQIRRALARGKDAPRFASSTGKGYRTLAERLLPDAAPSRKTVGTGEAEQLFSRMRDGRLGFRYPQEYCVARAHVAAAALAREGIAAHKVQAFGDLRATTPNAPGNEVRWGMHIAVAIDVREPSGRVRELVLDPALFDHPVGRDRWLRRINAGKDAAVYRVAAHKTGIGDSADGWTASSLADALAATGHLRKLIDRQRE